MCIRDRCVCVHAYLCLTTDQIHLMTSHIHSLPIKPVVGFEDMTLTRTNVDISMETMSIWAFWVTDTKHTHTHWHTHACTYACTHTHTHNNTHTHKYPKTTEKQIVLQQLVWAGYSQLARAVSQTPVSQTTIAAGAESTSNCLETRPDIALHTASKANSVTETEAVQK